MKTLYIFIGPPGSGKGTLSRMCVQKMGWLQFSTGDLCRRHIKEQTAIGKQIDFAIKSGKLIADELVTEMVFDWLQSSIDGGTSAIIFDGYPRTVTQAYAFNNIIYERFNDIKIRVIKLSITDDSAIVRLSGRYICQNEKCQKTYSVLAENLNSKKSMVCDVCSHALVRRADDRDGTVIERLKIYRQHEQTLIDFYTKNKNHIVEFNVEKPVDQVFEQFQQLISVVNVL